MNKEKKRRIIKLVALVVAILNLLIIDATILDNLQQKSKGEYYSVGREYHQEELEKGTVDTRFEPVSEKVKQVRLSGNFSVNKKDNISYEILDKQEKVLYSSGEIELELVCDEEGQSILLSTEEVTFKPGQEYCIRVNFDLVEKANLSMDNKGIINTQTYQVSNQNVFYVIMAGIHIMTGIFLYIIYKEGYTDRVFLALLLVIGLLAVVMTIPFSRDDEFRHFVRAYDLATGEKNHFYGQVSENVCGVVMPDDNGNAAYVKIPAEVDALREVDYANHLGEGGYNAEINRMLCVPKLYSMLKKAPSNEMVWASATVTFDRTLSAYWPQVMMIALGNLLGVRAIYLYYLAKSGQMLITALMFWLSWKLAPKYRALWSICAFFPSTILFCASCSSDGLMIAEITLVLALVLRTKEKGISVSIPAGVLSAIGFVILEYNIYKMKLPYALIGLGALLLLLRRKPTKKEWGVVGCVLLAGILLVFWKKELFLSLAYKWVPQPYLEFWMNNFVWVSNTMFHTGLNLLRQTWEVSRGLSFVHYGVLGILVALFSKINLKWLGKIYSMFLFLVMLGVVVLVGYTWSAPASGVIWGVTYRYVLPSLPLFLLALPVGSEKTEEVLQLVYPSLMVSVAFALTFSFGLL